MLVPATDSATARASANQRRRGRVVAHGVTCTLGRVLDISGGGMRLETRRALRAGQERIVIVRTPDGEFAAMVRVAWARRVGAFTRRAGVMFVDLSPQAKPALAACARIAGIRDLHR